MRKICSVIVLLCLIISNNALSQSSNHRPIFQLNHVDICVDSVTFTSILKNNFLRDSFAFVKVFTDSTGSEILLIGKEFFIHLLPEYGFFENRLGASLLVHHSYRQQDTKMLMEYLQSFTDDSLYNRPYVSSQYNIDYINVYENLGRKDSLFKFIPILQNYSTKDYLSWGYSLNNLQNGVTQKKYMSDYAGKETENKLFKNIETITVAVTSNEKTKIPSLLKAYGYKRKRNRYNLPGGPTVYLTERKNNLRTVRLVISLSKRVPNQKVIISENTVLTLANKTATLTYTAHENYR
jgi:hypothetical protein